MSETMTPANESTPETSRPTLEQLLWRYSYAYTAAHDFAVSDQIMTDDYALHMGVHSLRGRREQYQPATERQYRQYPTLGFTVHRLVTNGERAALHFTEHGRSIHGGRAAAWQGVSLYRWNGRQLTECRVEQDYYSRKHQIDTGEPLPVGSPGIDPWSAEPAAEDSTIAPCVTSWLKSGAWLSDPGPRWDDGTGRARWMGSGTEILDLFTAGATAAFHVYLVGRYAGGIAGAEQWVGEPADLFVTGIVDVGEGITGQLVTDRRSMITRLAKGS